VTTKASQALGGDGGRLTAEEPRPRAGGDLIRYSIGGGWLASYQRCWLPGVLAAERARRGH
jgi:hypothetical protein